MLKSSRFRTALFTAALTLGLFAGARAITLFSSQQGDVNFPGLSPTSLGTYTKSVPLTGFSATFGQAETIKMFRPAGTLLAGYVTLAALPFDGAESCIYSTQIVTFFYLAAGASTQTLQDAITALAANTRYCYKYSLANTTWNRSQ